MKHLILWTSLLATSVSATELVTMQTYCSTTQDATEKLMGKYGERPILMGKGVISDPANPSLPGIATIWYSQTADTFSVTFTPKADINVTCYLVTGTSLTEQSYEDL